MKLVILERDGVINQDSESIIKSPDEWIPIPGSLEAIATLNQSGYRVVVTANQTTSVDGVLNIDALNAIHRKMYSELEAVGGHLDGVFFCPHAPSENCDCRMPGAGLLEEISERFALSLEGIPVVGHSGEDIEYAQSAGASPLLVLTGRDKSILARLTKESRVPVFADLRAAAEAILARVS